MELMRVDIIARGTAVDVGLIDVECNDSFMTSLVV